MTQAAWVNEAFAAHLAAAPGGRQAQVLDQVKEVTDRLHVLEAILGERLELLTLAMERIVEKQQSTTLMLAKLEPSPKVKAPRPSSGADLFGG